MGTVVGIGLNIYIGNQMGAACATASILTKAIKIAGTAGESLNLGHALGNIFTGNGTSQDWADLGFSALALLGVKACFEGGTQVVVGTNPDGTYQTRNIEGIQVGDWVLTRDQHNPDAPPTLEQVSEVYRREVGSLRLISCQTASGNVETIRTTDEHPFYVAGLGWLAAKDLQQGYVVTTPDGGTAVVTGNAVRLLDQPITVYNFQVPSGHTYFVEDGQGVQTPVWVHNACGGTYSNVRSTNKGGEVHHLIANAVAKSAWIIYPGKRAVYMDGKGRSFKDDEPW